MSDQVLKKDGTAEGFERWEPPAMAGAHKPKPKVAVRAPAPKKAAAAPPPVTAEQIEQIQKQAHEEGFAQGQKEGLADAQRQIREKTSKLDKIMASFTRPMAEQDDELVEEVVELAMVVAKQLIRRQLKQDPGEVVAVVREAMAALPVSTSTIRLQLNPEDAEVIRNNLPSAEGERAWSIIEDAALSRGGCRITTENSTIDSTMETRIAAVVAQLMGGERDEDQRA
ncbi:hypothetical protein BOW53_00665 [Solemya pervernicosa gill symbiont]|uniref:Flagellar assembly protein FliH n=1 Tax=Solemya pervernicosa gill symbiont TaxID=642797 RepID=A0A1T2LAZ4_9GAMM|nr:flagellar assembly protein FliH [Solemya pervernicosa gill symbiont]OOZ42126.1 hypothetical protein BOW53_00665 [Solemya pervernicosa gill symbiont]